MLFFVWAIVEKSLNCIDRIYKICRFVFEIIIDRLMNIVIVFKKNLNNRAIMNFCNCMYNGWFRLNYSILISVLWVCAISDHNGRCIKKWSKIFVKNP